MTVVHCFIVTLIKKLNVDNCIYAKVSTWHRYFVGVRFIVKSLQSFGIVVSKLKV